MNLRRTIVTIIGITTSLISFDGGQLTAEAGDLVDLKTAPERQILQRVILSSDAGTSWIRLSKLFPEKAQVFSLSNLNGRIYAVLYQNGLYSWTDFDTGWSKMGTVTPLALAVVDDTLVAGHNPGGLYWSDNLGRSWSKSHGMEGPFLESGLGNSPMELEDDAPVWEMAAGQGLVIAGASSGIFISEDFGHTWKRSWRGLPANAPGVSFLISKETVYAGVTLGMQY